MIRVVSLNEGHASIEMRTLVDARALADAMGRAFVVDSARRIIAWSRDTHASERPSIAAYLRQRGVVAGKSKSKPCARHGCANRVSPAATTGLCSTCQGHGVKR
jgi:hypothetical protein